MQCRQTLLASFYHPYTSLSSRLLPLDAKSIPVARFARRKRSDSYIIKIQRGVEKDRRTEVGDGFPWKVNSLFHSEYSIVSLSLSLSLLLASSLFSSLSRRFSSSAAIVCSYSSLRAASHVGILPANVSQCFMQNIFDISLPFR